MIAASVTSAGIASASVTPAHVPAGLRPARLRAERRRSSTRRCRPADIQATVDAVAAQQVDNEMGTQRYALLFKPGTYGTAAQPLIFQVGYYTEVAGLGAVADRRHHQRVTSTSTTGA